MWLTHTRCFKACSAVLFVCGLCFAMTGCDEVGDAVEDAGDNIQDAAEDTGDAIEDAVN